MERAAGASTAPAGIIGILTSDNGRYSRFWLAVMATQRDPRVRLDVKISVNIAEARNQVLASAEESGAPWVWFLDDDHLWEPSLLVRLLAREVDVVQPTVLIRQWPFGPVHMGPPAGDRKYWRYSYMPGQQGLMECYALGAAGMLIRRKVWQAIPQPWFEVGQIYTDELGEDVRFSQKVHEAGFKMWCDLDNPLGHILPACVTPRRKPDGSWYTELEMGQAKMEIPAAEAQAYIDAQGNTIPADRVTSSEPPAGAFWGKPGERDL